MENGKIQKKKIELEMGKCKWSEGRQEIL